MKFVLTIHSPAFHGDFSSDLIEDFYGLRRDLYEGGALRFQDRASTLKAAIVYCDHITTVSKTHANELLTYEGSFGLHSILYSHRDKFTGILNGIDTDEWNPLTDPHLLTPIVRQQLQTSKEKNKAQLFKTFGLEHPQYPLFGLVSRLTFQKGIQLIIDNLDHFVQAGAKFIFLGAGESHLENQLKYFENKYPKAVALFNASEYALPNVVFSLTTAVLFCTKASSAPGLNLLLVVVLVVLSFSLASDFLGAVLFLGVSFFGVSLVSVVSLTSSFLGSALGLFNSEDSVFIEDFSSFFLFVSSFS
jgi:starch synthase